MKTVAVVLAAGFSVRLGQPKQLLDFRGLPLVRHAAIVALGAGCDETFVIGPYHDVLHGLPLTTIANPNASEGVSSSIRVAIENARGARILFTLCDQPLVTSEHLRALVACDAPIVATAYGDTIGVPAVFTPNLQDELLSLRGDRGARAVIQAHLPEVVAIASESAGVDVDTLSDYSKLGV